MHVDFTTADGKGFLISEQVRIAFWSTGGRATGIAVAHATVGTGARNRFPNATPRIFSAAERCSKEDKMKRCLNAIGALAVEALGTDLALGPSALQVLLH